MTAAKERAAASDKRRVTDLTFRFRLERVRAVRERREKLAKQDLARAIADRSSVEAQLRETEEHLERAHEHQRAAGAEGSISSGDLVARQAFLERIEAQRGLHARELGVREAEVAVRDAQLTTAATEHEMLNRLRERRRGEHQRELARLEGNALDEIAAARGRGGAA